MAKSVSEKAVSKSSGINIEAEYRLRVRRKILLGAAAFALILLSAGLSVRIGALPLGFREIAAVFFSRAGEDIFRHVVVNIRLARTVAALAAGAGLGVSGAIMQNVLKNPLASPFTIGVSQGAVFGASFAIIVLGAGLTHTAGDRSVSLISPNIVVLSAFIGSLIAVAFILTLSCLKSITAEAVILAGVALNALFGAATMFLQYFTTDIQVAATVFWTFGDVGKVGWVENLYISGAVVAATAYFILMRWSYNAVVWGDEVASSLGVRVRRLRFSGMLIASFVAAVITAFVGIIGFVGLIAPHVVRFFTGKDYRFLIPYSALFGALLLLCSDIGARIIIPSVTLPVGIITSFAGAPLFLYLLITLKRI